jgi:hypothetical protein
MEARRQPSLSFLPFSLPDLLTQVHKEFFRDIAPGVEIVLVDRGPLACIAIEPRIVFVHNLLNHPETPLEVMRFLCKHELLHLRVPAKEIKGRETSHPPEFWKQETAIAPERGIAWNWVWANFYSCLRRDKKLEGIFVKPNWKSSFMKPRQSLEHCIAEETEILNARKEADSRRNALQNRIT